MHFELKVKLRHQEFERASLPSRLLLSRFEHGVMQRCREKLDKAPAQILRAEILRSRPLVSLFPVAILWVRAQCPGRERVSSVLGDPQKGYSVLWEGH